MQLRSSHGIVGMILVGAVAVMALTARELRGQVTPSPFHIFVQEVGTTSDSPFINISENTSFAVTTPFSAPISFLIAVPSARWGNFSLDNTLIVVSAKKDGQEVMDGTANTAEVNAAAVFYGPPFPPSCSSASPCLTSMAFLSEAAVNPGTYSITISANDGTNATSAAFTWTVLPEEPSGSASSKEIVSPSSSSTPARAASSEDIQASSTTSPSDSCGNCICDASETLDTCPWDCGATRSGGDCFSESSSVPSLPAVASSAATESSKTAVSASSAAAPSPSPPSSVAVASSSKASSVSISSARQSQASVACGNGVREGGELCDKQDLGGVTCLTLGYDGGRLTCSASCAFDVSLCEKKDVQKKAFCCDVVMKSTTPVSFFLRVYIPSLWKKLEGGPTCKASVFVQTFEQAKTLCDRLPQEQEEDKRPVAPPDRGNGTGGNGSRDGKEGSDSCGNGVCGNGETASTCPEDCPADWGDGSDDATDGDGDGGGGDGGDGVGGGECCVAPDGAVSPVPPPPSTFAGQAWAAAKEVAEWVIDIFTDVELNPPCGGGEMLTKGPQCRVDGVGGLFGECADGKDNDTDDFTDADDPDCSDFDGENSTYNPERFERPCETGKAMGNLPVASLLAQVQPCNPPQLGWACCFNNRTCSQYAIPSPPPRSIDDLPCSRSNMYGVTESPLGGRPIFGLASAARDACRVRCGQSSSGGGNSSATTYPGQRVCCSRSTSPPQRPTCTTMTITESPANCRGHVYTTEPPQNWDDPMAACRNGCGFSRFCCNQIDGTWKEFFVTMNELSPCTNASRTSPYSDVPVELQLSFPSFLSLSPAYDLTLPSTAPACPLKRICCDHVAGEWLVTTNQTCRAASPPRPQVLFAGGEDWAVDPVEGPYNKNSFSKCTRFMICANVTKNKCEATTSDRPCRQLGPDQYMPEEYPYSEEGLAQCRSTLQPEDPPAGDYICCRRTTSPVPRFDCVSSYQRYCNDQIGAGQVSVKEYGTAPDARAKCAAECPTIIWCYSKKDEVCKSWPFPPDTTNINTACLGFCGAMTKESCEANCK